MVCRVFQKSLLVKKPQQTNSSQPDSPCDTVSVVNEFGDVELPNLNSIANSSGGLTENISGQTFMNADISNSVNTSMNLAMNWAVANEVHQVIPSLPSLPWPSGLLSPTISSVNSLLLKALQLRSYQQREAAAEAAAATDHFASFMGHGVSQVGTDLSSNLTASSSKVQECMPQQQQQQEQPFNLDSIW